MTEHHQPVRVREPQRKQIEMRWESIDEFIAPDHPARLIERAISKLDLKKFTRNAKAMRFRPGRPVYSPRMMLTLWLYAISEGIGSAREIERRTREDAPFRWIVGDLRPSHDLINEFRLAHGDVFDELLTEVLAILHHKGLVKLDVVAQDGTRIRASASAPSFRSKAALGECREQAALHLKATLAAAEDQELSTKERAAREAKARDFQRRVDEALAEVETIKPAKKGKKARASTTDKDARVMKMADGGFRPAYNAQLAVAGDKHGGPRTIVGVRVTNKGSDMGSITPMLDDIEARTSQRPKVLLADANHCKKTCIDECEARGVTAVVPVFSHGGRPATPRADDSPAVRRWRKRMAEPAAKALYRQRSALAEFGMGAVKDRLGLNSMPVRGSPKVATVVLLTALAFNITQHLTALA